MLLTAPLLSKSSSFLGSLLHKFRQVKITKSDKVPTSSTTKNNAIKNINNNNNNFTPSKINAADATLNTNATTKNLLNTYQIDSRPILLNTNHSLSTTAITFKTYEEQIGLPPRPKRPLTPYFRYMRDMRPKMLAENPKLKTQDIVKQLSKLWASGAVDAKTKDRLQNEFKREQQAYVEQRAKYDAKVTPEQKAEILQLKKEKQEAMARRKLRRRVRDLGRPKRPASAFFRFVNEERSSQLPNQAYREWHKNCTAKWARLTEAEKASYMKEAKEDMETYKKQLHAWEERMLRMGNVDVVRVGHQIDPPEPKSKEKKST